MAMSDARILKAMDEGHIIIDPFHPEYLSTSSYDVCLGEYFYREQVPPKSQDHLLYPIVFNPYDPAQVKNIWGVPQKAERAASVLPFPYANIDPDDRVILLAPGETILAHTEEFVGGRFDITTMMKARSTYGRTFILVCKCAGWGDVGYFNRWTMEVTNVSTHYHIPLIVGERIAQMVFMDTGPILDIDYSSKGNYQNSDALAELKANWTPESMLPKLKRTVRRD